MTSEYDMQSNHVGLIFILEGLSYGLDVVYDSNLNTFTHVAKNRTLVNSNFAIELFMVQQIPNGLLKSE